MGEQRAPKLKINIHPVVGRHATWLELFYDLVYVAVLAQLTHMFIEDFTFDGLMRLVFLLVVVLWAWAGHTMYSNRFDMDDSVHRILTFLQMFLALLLAVFITHAFDETANAFAMTYFGIRFLYVLSYLRIISYHKNLAKPLMPVILGFGFECLLWIISIYVPTPFKFLVWAEAIIISLYVPRLGIKGFEKAPVHPEHLPERLGLFVIVVLGESIVAVVTGISHIQWHVVELVTAVSGFVLAVSIWWLYFEFLERFIVGEKMRTGHMYLYGHIPLYIGLTLLAVGIGQIILSEPWVPQQEIRSTICVGLLLFLAPLAYWRSTRIPFHEMFKVMLPDFIMLVGIVVIFFCNEFWTPSVFSAVCATIFLIYVVQKHNCCYSKERLKRKRM